MAESIYVLEPAGSWNGQRVAQLKLAPKEWGALVRIVNQWGGTSFFATDEGFSRDDTGIVVGAMERALVPVESEPSKQSPKAFRPGELHGAVEPLGRPVAPQLRISEADAALINKCLPFIKSCRRGFFVVRHWA